MREKIRNIIDKTSEVLEIVINVILIIAVVIAIISLWNPLMEFIQNRGSAQAFLHFLEYVLNILIGIEFFKMLCKPDMDTVLDVVIFVIVRHMIVIETSAVENLLTIIGIAIVFAVKKFLKPSGPSIRSAFRGRKEKNSEAMPEETVSKTEKETA